MKILHFSDAHIDIAGQGRHDPQSGLPVRVQDFLKSLDTIVEAAIAERVDLVLFAGDAYKDRTPVPTFQREWGRRIARLSNAGIPTLLLVGNHDLSPATGRAHAMQEFETLPIAHVKVASRPMLLKPEDLDGVPLQVLALPWVSRSSLMASLGLSGADPEQVYSTLEERLSSLVQIWLEEQINPDLPVILAAHVSVQGAVYGAERAVMLGSDVVLSGSLVRDPRFSYVALGHIHKSQDLNHGQQPPVVYPGSIERVDFGEAQDDKFYVIAHLEQGQPTLVEWRKLEGRRFIDRSVRLTSMEGVSERLIAALSPQGELAGAIVRLVIEYPVQYEQMLNEPALRRYAEPAFEFHLVRRPQREARLRLPVNQAIASLTPLDLLDVYWRSAKSSEEDLQELQGLAREIIASVSGMGDD